METQHNEIRPGLSHAEPILAVKDVSEAISYWHSVLGFPEKWTWGNPVNHGGVSWNGVQIQFSHNPALASTTRGYSIFIKVKNLRALYDFHKNQNVEIVEPLENKPWGMAGYTVREINGYFIIFAGAPISDREKSAATLPQIVAVIERTPTKEEYLNLFSAVGWGKYLDEARIEKILQAPLFAVVANDSTTNDVVGCALLLGDDAGFFYVKDVIVHPKWQNMRVGSAMMEKISEWLKKNAPDNAFVVLITPENLAPFYQQFGFTPAFGMIRIIQSSQL